jgi:hypothetical protein
VFNEDLEPGTIDLRMGSSQRVGSSEFGADLTDGFAVVGAVVVVVVPRIYYHSL